MQRIHAAYNHPKGDQKSTEINCKKIRELDSLLRIEEKYERLYLQSVNQAFQLGEYSRADINDQYHPFYRSHLGSKRLDGLFLQTFRVLTTHSEMDHQAQNKLQ